LGKYFSPFSKARLLLRHFSFAKWILKPFPALKLREALASYLKGWVAENGGWIWMDPRFTAIYPLVNVYITMERSTIFHGTNHYKW